MYQAGAGPPLKCDAAARNQLQLLGQLLLLRHPEEATSLIGSGNARSTRLDAARRLHHHRLPQAAKLLIAACTTNRILEEDADVDDDVADLLQGTGGDPDVIRSRVSGWASSP